MSRILIVDHNDLVRYTLANLLRFEGHEVDQASNGLQALARFAARPCDAVLMELFLPYMDGLEACRRLRQQSQVPILILSAHGDPSIQDQALAYGASAFQHKPLDCKRLLAWIRSTCAGIGSPSRPELTGLPMLAARPCHQRQVESKGAALP